MTEAETQVDQSTDAGAEEAKYRLSLEVNIDSVGPCRKHVRVKVARTDIDHFLNEAVEEVIDTVTIPGFRKGKVPASLARRRFDSEISSSVRHRVLMQSLEQLAEENSLDPINEPDFDVGSLEIPEEGDFEYEFDIEVRPDFELPNYSGLRIQRPVKEVTTDDVSAYVKQFTDQYSTFEDVDGPASPD
ncbi:MAG: trigger factor, partial [Planctomycetes bacterium]|nr:trigger factor [Planctomycetota bacterium]